MTIRDEIAGQWVDESPEYLDGLRRWAEYYVTTDEFDAATCTGRCPATGAPMPATPAQRDLSVSFAFAALRRLRITKKTPGKRDAILLSDAGRRDLLARYGPVTPPEEQPT